MMAMVVGGEVRRWVMSSLVAGFIIPVAFGASPIAEGRVREIAGWLSAEPAGPGRPISDRAAWGQVTNQIPFANILAEAQKLAGTPVPELDDSLYLDYSRTGNRERCQRVLSSRDGRLVTLTLAECVENQGRFLQPLGEIIAAICREKTWVLPAHDRNLQNFKGTEHEMDLRATTIAWELATCAWLMGDKLPAATRQMIRENVEARVLIPFREMVEGKRKAISWIGAKHNWNAVCLAGTTGTALAVEPRAEDRAWYVAAGEHYIQNFLGGFTPDGYCSEGIGYWNYGFGRFLMLSEAVREATKGHVDLLANPKAMAPALACTRTEIINGLYPTIADCAPGSRPDPQYVTFICRRFGVPFPAGVNPANVRPPSGLASTALFAFLPASLAPIKHDALPADSPVRTWFGYGGVLICRPGTAGPVPFAAVLKGGNNAEYHNHNDLGSFSVVVGTSMVICDPGSEIYTARTFSNRRYESKVLSSLGHAVPVVGGHLQREGAQAKAVVLRTDFTDAADTLVLDLRSAYPAPALRKLERTFVYRRSGAQGLTVRDDVSFGEPKSFESALVTWGRWRQVEANALVLEDSGGAVRVKIDTGGVPFAVSSEPLNENLPGGRKPVRIAISLTSPVRDAAVAFEITPETASSTK